MLCSSGAACIQKEVPGQEEAHSTQFTELELAYG